MSLRTFLDASSGHLSPDTWAWRDDQLSDALLRSPENGCAAQIAGGKTHYGWLVYAPGDSPDGLPEDLATVLTVARECGAEYVLFDCDAVPDGSLPVRHPDFLE
jgi:hypothetical protein